MKEETGRKMDKNPFKILGDGTKLSGLVTDEENKLPRECHNCIWYKHDKCHHPVVMVDPEVLGEPGQPKPVGDHWCCNFMKSPGRVLLYIVRHGEDLDDEIIGGWNDPELDTRGVRDAREAAAMLKDKGIRHIVSSDLERTIETSIVIAKHLGMPEDHVEYDFRLRTWDKGYLNGAEKTPENQKTLEHYKDNPHLVIPKGESRSMFDDRTEQAFEHYIKRALTDGVYIIVTHNSVIKNAQEYCEGAEDYTSPDSVMPGGIIEISEKKGDLLCRVIFKDRPKERG